MPQIKVTASEVRKKAEELRQLNSQFSSKVDELTSQEQSVASKWEGEARDAFHNAFNTDKTKWDEFHRVIEQYAVALDNIATEYEAKENMNVNIASTRTV